MIFERPDFLWIVPASIAVAIVAAILHARRRRKATRALGGRPAALRLTGVDLQRAPLVRYALVAAAAGLLSLAGAGPRLPAAPTPPPAHPVDAVVVIDLSRSMGLDDALPSRIGAAQDLVERVLDAFPSDRVGLVGFAHEAYALVPPTHDHEVVRYFLDALDPAVVPDADQGSRPEQGLQVARELLLRRGTPDARQAIVLISDGEAHEERARILDTASALADSGMRVFSAGIGSEEGAPLMRHDFRGRPSGPFLGPDGQPVTSRLDREFLESVADAGGGVYLTGDPGDDPVLRLLSAVGRERPGDGPTRKPERVDLPFFFGLAALALLLVESGAEAVVATRGRRRRGRV